MHSVRVLAEAAAEAEEAAAWYEGRRPGLGSEFRAELRQALAQLREAVVPGRAWSGVLGERGVKRVLLKRFPFSVAYVVTGTSRVVVAVAHHRKRPGYWRHRLPELER